MEKIGVRVQEMNRLTFTNKPFGTGFIQNLVLNGTLRDSEVMAERHIQGFLFPRMQETIEEILNVAKRKQREENKKNQPKIDQQENSSGLRFADDIVKGAYIPDFAPYLPLEKQRLAKFNKERACPDWDKDFAYGKLDHVFEGVTLKHLIHHKCSYENGNMIEEIYEHGDAYELKY